MSDDGTGRRAPAPSGGRRPVGGLVGGGVPLGRVFGIPILVSPWWFLIAAIITIQVAPYVEQHYDVQRGAAYVVAFGFVVLLYGSVLLHELGHSLVARALGLPVRRIVLQLLGGVSEITKEPETAGREYLISAAGPMVSVLLAGVGWAVLLEMPEDTVAQLLVANFAIVNGMVAVFNLLPGLPLDGGRLLRAVLWHLAHDPLRATQIAAWVGRGLAVLVAAAPLVVATVSRREVTFFQSFYLLLLAFFIWGSASGALAQARMRSVLPRLSARELTRRALPVRADTPLAEAIRRAQGASARALVIVDGDGRPTALVSESAVAALPQERRPWVPVSDFARAVDDEVVLDADLQGEALIEAVQSAPASEYLVVERGGRVYGVLAQADVLAFLQAQSSGRGRPLAVGRR